MAERLRRMGRWIVARFGLEPIIEFVTEHKVPAALKGPSGWMYVFGFATLTTFIGQLLTGLALSTSYVGAVASAHDSLVHITEETTWGPIVRGMHYYGASAMVVMLLLHMARVYLTAAYKFPRQTNWMTGVLLATLTFAMALTGQLLRWDENGLWTVVVISKFFARVPLVGAELARFVLAGDEVNAATLPRFASLHMILLPGLMLALIGVHMYLLLRSGISEPPNVETPTDPDAYLRWYEEHKKTEGVHYVPHSSWKEIVVSFAVVAGIVTLALVLGPKGPGPPPDPTAITAQPMPDWFVRFYFALLALKPGSAETFVMVYLPLGLWLVLFLLPVFAGHGPRALRHRPWAVAILVAAGVTLGWLTAIGLRSSWTPDHDQPPLGAAELGTSDPAVLAGAQIFRDRGCQLCHAALGTGGGWGPDLTHVAVRLPPEEIAVRIVQGFREMPAYRDVLQDGELETMLTFLRALPPRAAEARR